MKRLRCPIALALAALLVLCACAPTDVPSNPADGSTDSTPAQTTSPDSVVYNTADRLTDRYDSRVNTYYPIAGTFTDRIDASVLMQLMTMSQSPDAPPMLYNIVQLLSLTRDDIVLYSEMGGDKITLEPELIDALFLQGEAMYAALRGEFALFAGGRLYTVYDLAALSADELAALAIPEAELRAFLAQIPDAAAYTGDAITPAVDTLLSAYGIE